MLSYIGIFRRKFIWSNLQVIFLRGRPKSVVSRRLYMDSSRVQGCGLFSITISGIGFHQCHSDHSVFVQRTKSDIVVWQFMLITFF